MKLLIAGSRDKKLSKEGIEYLNKLFFARTFSLLINGAAKGIDLAAAKWALSKDLPIKYFHPNFKKYGKAGGPIRNSEMIADMSKGDVCVYFFGNAGTADCFRRAEKAGLEVIDLRDKLNFVEDL